MLAVELAAASAVEHLHLRVPCRCLLGCRLLLATQPTARLACPRATARSAQPHKLQNGACVLPKCRKGYRRVNGRCVVERRAGGRY